MDCLVSLTGYSLVKPLADSFDEVIESSRWKAVPYAAGMFLLGVPFALVETVGRLAFAILTSPLLLAACCGRYGEEVVQISAILFATVIENSVECAIAFVAPFICMYAKEQCRHPEIEIADTNCVKVLFVGWRDGLDQND